MGTDNRSVGRSGVRRRWRSVVIAGLVLVGAALAPGAAAAAVDCAVNGAVMTVSSTGADSIALERSGSAIQVNGVTCGSATVTTIDSIEVDESAGANADQTLTIDLSGGDFAPGVSSESPGLSEIEIAVHLGGGRDGVIVRGGNASEVFRLGEDGIALNSDDDADVTFDNFVSYRLRELDGVNGDDVLSAQGGGGSGAPLGEPAALRGGNGNDTLVGGEGDDDLRGGDGDDAIDGRGGSDTVSYGSAPGSVSADLAAGAASGEGTDTLTGIENLTGSDFDDTLSGDSGPNVLKGGLGNDTLSGADDADNLQGGDGNDSLSGGNGNDTLDGGLGDDAIGGDVGVDLVSYAGAPASVSVDLASGSASGGEGSDTLSSVEQLSGSEFNDTLGGDARANFIRGRGGNDVILGRGGSDQLRGEIGSDTLDGGAGGDQLSGDVGNDRLNGGSGADSLDGGAGNDVLNGGSGADRLLARDRNHDVVNGGSGRDRAAVDRRKDTVRGVERLI
jgi:Ca2+-binding RTX toxin-like protein